MLHCIARWPRLPLSALSTTPSLCKSRQPICHHHSALEACLGWLRQSAVTAKRLITNKRVFTTASEARAALVDPAPKALHMELHGGTGGCLLTSSHSSSSADILRPRARAFSDAKPKSRHCVSNARLKHKYTFCNCLNIPLLFIPIHHQPNPFTRSTYPVCTLPL